MKISIGFLGNINFDTRTFNLFKSLKKRNCDVIFNGFDWLTPDFEAINSDEIHVEKLVKTNFSLLFYLKFGFKLLSALLKQNSDIYFAGDVYSLPFCVIAAKLKRKKVYYDSREVYTELPALNDKKLVKLLMRLIEGHYIKKIDMIFTTGRMDSLYIENLYKLHHTEVLRNLPLKKENIVPVNFCSKNITENSIKLLYQGIIVKGRGIDTYFELLTIEPGCSLILLGGGEHLEYYKNLSEKMGIANRVFFAGKVTQDELLNYTAGADIGLSIIDNISKNSLYALPNKLFEYIMAGIPVIISDLPQMREIVDEFKVGEIVKPGDKTELLNAIRKIGNSGSYYNELKENCRKASEQLNWEKEFKKVENYFINHV